MQRRTRFYLLAESVDFHVTGMASGIDLAFTAGEVRPVIANHMSEAPRFIRAVALGQDCPRDEIGHLVEQPVDPAFRLKQTEHEEPVVLAREKIHVEVSPPAAPGKNAVI